VNRQRIVSLSAFQADSASLHSVSARTFSGDPSATLSALRLA
jgi:hypothetical protein